ncbi:helix-turn-helix domain-containing protein [Kitasatospora sp. GAS1066B]|uniref:ATP-binding protein n=1 Tax=Kitasatospora sp. GAS1066B TaxID=3156271 RepID=UPI0035163EA3
MVVHNSNQQTPTVSFGRLLIAHRQSAGLTQSELAAASALSVRAISELETGRSRAPQDRSARALAEALGLTPQDRSAFLAVAASGRTRTAQRKNAAAAHPGSGSATGAGPGSAAAAPAHAGPGAAAAAGSAQPTGAPSPTPAPAAWPLTALSSRPPAAPTDFTGRRAELDRLRAVAEAGAFTAGRGSTLVIASGQPGLGKTSLALRLAEELGRRFPDGALYLDLRGVDVRPLTTDEALARLLGSLGVPHDRLPLETAERTRLYRSLLSERRVLVLLDNALDERQVRPLLPGGPHCLTLVTSRRALAGLEGAERLLLEVLPAADAIALLERIGGPRPRRQLAELASLCGYLPLALRIVGRRLAVAEDGSAELLAEQLRDEERRLDGMAAGELQVRAAFQHSYRQLAADRQTFFRRLALVPGADFGPQTVAALCDLSAPAAEELLEGLVEVGLLEPAHAAFRYRFHDLVRLFAGEALARDEPAAERERARVRLMSALLGTAIEAGHAFDPAAQRPASGQGWSGAADWLDGEFAHWTEAVRWAAEQGEHRLVLDTAVAMHWYSDVRLHQAYWCELFGFSAAAAAALDDLPAAAVHLNYLSWALSCSTGQHAEAVEVAERAAAAARAAGDVLQQAWAAMYRAAALRRLRSLPESAAESARAAALMIEADFPLGRWVAERNRATALRMMGRAEEAAAVHERVVLTYDTPNGAAADAPSQHGLALALRELAEDHAELGDWAKALAAYRRAIGLYRTIGFSYAIAQLQVAAGRALHELRSAEAARELDAALDFYTGQRDLAAPARTLAGLAQAIRSGEAPERLDQYWERAVRECSTLA